MRYSQACKKNKADAESKNFEILFASGAKGLETNESIEELARRIGNTPRRVPVLVIVEKYAISRNVDVLKRVNKLLEVLISESEAPAIPGIHIVTHLYTDDVKMVKGALDELCIIPDIIRPCKKGEGEEGQELVLVESASDYERKTPYVPREIAKDLVQANRLTVYVEEDFAEQLRVSSVVLPQIPRERRITIGGTQMGEQELLVAIDDAIREASNRPRRQQILLNLLLKDSLSSVWTQSVLDALMKFIKLGDTAILVRGQKLPEGVLPRRESEEDSRLIRYMETVNENGIVTVRELDL